MFSQPFRQFNQHEIGPLPLKGGGFLSFDPSKLPKLNKAPANQPRVQQPLNQGATRPPFQRQQFIPRGNPMLNPNMTGQMMPPKMVMREHNSNGCFGQIDPELIAKRQGFIQQQMRQEQRRNTERDFERGSPQSKPGSHEEDDIPASYSLEEHEDIAKNDILQCDSPFEEQERTSEQVRASENPRNDQGKPEQLSNSHENDAEINENSSSMIENHSTRDGDHQIEKEIGEGPVIQAQTKPIQCSKASTNSFETENNHPNMKEARILAVSKTPAANSTPKKTMGMDKPASKPPQIKEGDWLCPDDSCSNINFAKRTHCNRCGAQRPLLSRFNGKPWMFTQLLQDGTWSCSTCRNINQFQRFDCFMCGELRPEELNELAEKLRSNERLKAQNARLPKGVPAGMEEEDDMDNQMVMNPGFQGGFRGGFRGGFQGGFQRPQFKQQQGFRGGRGGPRGGRGGGMMVMNGGPRFPQGGFNQDGGMSNGMRNMVVGNPRMIQNGRNGMSAGGAPSFNGVKMQMQNEGIRSRSRSID